jgi:hypothetical protein
MSRFERRILVRFARSGGCILLLLAWLSLFFHLAQALARKGFVLEAAFSPGLLEKLMVTIEVALVFAAPLGFYHAIVDLQRRSILVVVLAARDGARRLRRSIFAAGVLTVLLAMVALQASAFCLEASKRERSETLWRSGAYTIWCPKRERGTRELTDVLVFSDRTLDVSGAPRGRISADGRTVSLPFLQAQAGAPLRPGAFRLNRPLSALLTVPAPLRWFSSTASVRETLAALNRVLTPGILVLLLAYLTLLIPTVRQGWALAAYLVLLPTVCLGMLVCSLMLWQDVGLGWLMETGWLALLGLAVVILDRAFARRGIRIS